jgi:hypothetical protein
MGSPLPNRVRLPSAVDFVSVLTVTCHSSCCVLVSQIFMLIAFIIYFPVYLAVRLFTNRKEIRAWKAASADLAASLRSAKRLGDEAATASAAGAVMIAPATSFALRLGHLYESYRSDTYYWQSVVLARRAIFVVFDVALTYYPAYKLAAYIIWCSCMLLFHVLMQPYEDEYNNKMETTTLFILVLIATVLQMNQTGGSGTNAQFHSYPVLIQVIVTLLIAFPCALLAWHMGWQALKPTYKFLKARVAIVAKRKSASRKGSFNQATFPRGGATEPEDSPPVTPSGDEDTLATVVPAYAMADAASAPSQLAPSDSTSRGPVDVDRVRRARMAMVASKSHGRTSASMAGVDNRLAHAGIELEEIKTNGPEPHDEEDETHSSQTL